MYHYFVKHVEFDGFKGWVLRRLVKGIMQEVLYFRTEREARNAGIEWLVAMGETVQ